MKLQQLAIGARFEYQDRVFVKTGPLTASSENGGQQLIPRYALLKPLDLPTPPPHSKRHGKLAETVVHSAFEAFYRTCSQLVDESSRPELEEARRRFLVSLK